jgi:hypothetical protein
LNQVKHQSIGGQIAFLSHLLQDRFVGVIIVVVMIISDIKEAIPSEPEGLVDLEIETDGSHM